MNRNKVAEVNKNAKKNEVNIPPSWSNKIGPQEIYLITKKKDFFLYNQLGKS